MGSVEAFFDDISVEHIESKVTQVADYYPFGMQIKPTSTDVSNPLANKYLYNGKEFQSELGLDWYDYGARMYDAAIGRFGIKDRLTELYPSLNPYQYTANNPIRFVDINGDYIDIYDEENGLRLIYEDGKTYFTKYDDDGNIVKGDEYDGEGTDFTNAVVQNLNDVSSTKNGKKVISSLSESKNNFTFLNSTPSNGGFNAFVPENDGGGSFKAANLADNSNTSTSRIRSTAHELFHGYQYENGQGISSVNNEVGAYLFAEGVLSSLPNQPVFPYYGNETEAGKKYQAAFQSLLYGSVFDLQLYKEAVSNFHKGSLANRNGIYNDVPDYIYLKKFETPLISKFYPLIE